MALMDYQIQLVDADEQPLVNFPVATRYAGVPSAKKNNTAFVVDTKVIVIKITILNLI